MPVCGNYLFFELPKKIVLNPKDGFSTDFFLYQCDFVTETCFVMWYDT